jgi:hypothetical protein
MLINVFDYTCCQQKLEPVEIVPYTCLVSFFKSCNHLKKMEPNVVDCDLDCKWQWNFVEERSKEERIEKSTTT